MTTYLDKIPAQIAAKVEDKDWALTFIFENMPCSHPPTAAEFEKIDCLKCKIDVAEKWIEQTLTDTTGTETTKDKMGNILNLQKIVVMRGKYDDVIGLEWNWS